MNRNYLLNNKFFKFFMALVYAKGSHEPVSVKYSSTCDNKSGAEVKMNVDFVLFFSTVHLCPFTFK